MLTLADVPPSALQALRDTQPTFVPWDTSAYSLEGRAGAPVSSDEGLVVIRGAFREAGVQDYVIAGRTKWGPMIVALLAQKDGTYKVVGVSDGGRSADSTTGEPPVILGRITAENTSAGAPPLEIVVRVPGQSPVTPLTRYAWVPARRSFLLVGVAD